jgi:hypothetical protein
MLFRFFFKERKINLPITFLKSFHSLFKSFFNKNINLISIDILNLIKDDSLRIVTIR